MQTPYKQCPQCGRHWVLEAQRCEQCGQNFNKPTAKKSKTVLLAVGLFVFGAIAFAASPLRNSFSNLYSAQTPKPKDAVGSFRLETPEWEKVPVAFSQDAYNKLEAILESTDTLTWTDQSQNVDRQAPGQKLATLEQQGQIALCEQNTLVWSLSAIGIPVHVEIAEGTYRGKRGYVAPDMLKHTPLPVP